MVSVQHSGFDYKLQHEYASSIIIHWATGIQKHFVSYLVAMAILIACYSYALYQTCKYKAVLWVSFKGEVISFHFICYFNENLPMFRRSFSRPPAVKTKKLRPNRKRKKKTLPSLSPCLHTQHLVKALVKDFSLCNRSTHQQILHVIYLTSLIPFI